MVQAGVLWALGSQGLDKGAVLGLHNGTALKVALNIVWVDLLKMRGAGGGDGGGVEASSAQAWVLFGNFLVS